MMLSENNAIMHTEAERILKQNVFGLTFKPLMTLSEI
jgi:hypothetical protein